MFCPKCGIELPDGSQFCPACGAQLGAPAPQQQYAQPAAPQQQYAQPAAPQQYAQPAAPQQQYAQPAAGGNTAVQFKLPDTSKLLTMFFALMSFIFGFLPLVHVSYGGYGDSGSIFSCGFSFNALTGIAMILLIFQILAFLLYIASQFVDFNKYLNLPFNVTEKMPLIYFGLYAAILLFTFIGSLIGPGYGISGSPAVCWYFAVVFCACGFVLIFKPNLLDNLIKKPQ